MKFKNTTKFENIMNEAYNFITFLKERLLEPLPSIEAQKKMAPVTDKTVYRHFKPENDSRQSAVLIPIVVNGTNELELLFTLRSSNLKSHKGQICFPGGNSNPNEDTIDTALRETYEEIGFNGNSIEVIGQLSHLFVPPSKSVIRPVIGFIKNIPDIKLNHNEVEEAFLVPLKFFTETDNIKYTEMTFNGQVYKIPHWQVHHKTILWGATAMILSELVEIYKEWMVVSE